MKYTTGVHKAFDDYNDWALENRRGHGGNNTAADGADL
jgi:hypothetical protein